MNICIFGDSTAWGAYDLEKGGWVNRLWLYLAKTDKDIDVYNLSISGGTTKTILDRFENEAKIRNANVLIFQSGGNDAYYNNAGQFKVPIDEFKKNIAEIISRSRKIADKMIFISFKNVDESRTMPVSWKDIYYKNENIQKYCEAMKEICDKNKILFLDIFDLLKSEELYDGLHPNEIGHEKLFQKVKDFLMENKII